MFLDLFFLRIITFFVQIVTFNLIYEKLHSP